MSACPVHDGDVQAARWRKQWLLEEGVAYLNHGSVGLSPRPVLDAWTGWIRRIDRQRLGFIRREANAALGEAYLRLGSFLGTSADRLAFTTSTTMAMLSVARSFPLEPGDEVLINDHEYWSVIEIWQRACNEAGAKLVVASIPVPVNDQDTLADTVFAGASERTKLVIFSHVTYRTSMVMPAEVICRRAHEAGIAVLVDGAHALVQCPVDIDSLECDFYVASCHKWLCAPAGTGFLWVHPRMQTVMKPLTGARRGTWRDAAFTGTEDHSRYLAVPAAIDFIESAGLDDFRRRSHELARYARERITRLTGIEPWYEDSSQWYASMAACELPLLDERALQDALWKDFTIEAYINRWNGRSLVRVSCHLYTQAAEIDRLVDALVKSGIGRPRA